MKRCAIYTRKSSEEGLEQGFNSLDAQREAGEGAAQVRIGPFTVCQHGERQQAIGSGRNGRNLRVEALVVGGAGPAATRCVEQIGDQVAAHQQRHQDQRRALDDRKVASEDRLDQQAAHAGQREYGFGDHRSGQQVPRLETDDGDDRHSRLSDAGESRL